MQSSKNINVLLYHQIGYKPNEFTNLDCFCSARAFYLQMQFLKEHNFSIIPLSVALSFIDGRKTIDKNYVVLTFDDGCETFYELAFPLLEAFNFPATIYPVAGCLGQIANWGKRYNPDLRILARNRLTELHKLGVEIGAHTMNHSKLTHISLDEAAKQINESKSCLEQIIGDRVNSFAYPHGNYDNLLIELVKEAGFSSGVTCLHDYGQKTTSVFEIPRKYITYFDNLSTFKQKLGHYENSSTVPAF